MPATQPCTPCCTTSQTVDVPGSPGQSAFTLTTANLTIPIIGGSVVAAVGNSDWMAVGETLFLSDGTDFGHFTVQSINSPVSVTLVFQGQTGDALPAAVIGSGAAVVATGSQQSLTVAQLKALNATILAGIVALTDSTGGTASNTLAAGSGLHYWTFYAKLSEVTAAATVGAFVPGYRFKIISLTWLGLQAGTGAGATITFTPTIGGVGLTGGGAVTPTLANAGAGSVVAGATITGANIGTAAQTFAITAGTITAFTNGTGTILVKVQNLDTADSFASLADKVNDILAALQT